MSSTPLSVSIIYNKANTFGISDDVIVIERILKSLHRQYTFKTRLVDMREPMSQADINIHLEIPVYSAISWAHTNIMLVNPEQWSYNYDVYANAFDALLFRDNTTADRFRADFTLKGISTDNIYVVPWCAALQVKDVPVKNTKNLEKGFVCFLAASLSKYEYVRNILPLWKGPSLTVYTTRDDFAKELRLIPGLAANIKIVCEDIPLQKLLRIMTDYSGHLVCSQGESFGYAAANAEVCGAFTILNRLPVFESDYDYDDSGVAWLSNTNTQSDKVRYLVASPGPDCQNELDNAFDAFLRADFDTIRKARQDRANSRFENTSSVFLNVLSKMMPYIMERRSQSNVCPPVLMPQDCPPISIITPTYNRKKLFEIAFHNLLLTDYPKDKIEWIVIEDNEKTPHMVGEVLMSFQVQLPQIKIKYIPIEGRMSIGEKRNHAIENATNDIILFMDDDDHYPETSFRRRVAWLTKGVKRGIVGGANIVCCTTIALYDLRSGISAVNVPPYDIPFAQRISEATLTFRKSAWLEKKFPYVSMAEGEEWIRGREEQVIEIPPQQIIVAFSHGSNQSSRRIPPVDQKPACFWGFPKEYLIFIHGLVNVEVEEDKRRKVRK